MQSWEPSPASWHGPLPLERSAARLGAFVHGGLATGSGGASVRVRGRIRGEQVRVEVRPNLVRNPMSRRFRGQLYAAGQGSSLLSGEFAPILPLGQLLLIWGLLLAAGTVSGILALAARLPLAGALAGLWLGLALITAAGLALADQVARRDLEALREGLREAMAAG